MPISQGSAGGHMPGLSLRAWALVTAAGVLVKGMNAAITKGAAGIYTLTLQNGNANANTITVVRGMPTSAGFGVGWVTSIAGADITYKINNINATAVDCVHHIEVWE